MGEEIAKLPREEANRVLRLPNSYYEKGKKEGIEKVIYNMFEKGITGRVSCGGIECKY